MTKCIACKENNHPNNPHYFWSEDIRYQVLCTCSYEGCYDPPASRIVEEIN